MTPEEMLARLLYRDGLMLVVDKPAGLPVHRGPKGGAMPSRTISTRYGSACRVRPHWHTALTGTRPGAWCLGATARPWRC